MFLSVFLCCFSRLFLGLARVEIPWRFGWFSLVYTKISRNGRSGMWRKLPDFRAEKYAYNSGRKLAKGSFHKRVRIDLPVPLLVPTHPPPLLLFPPISTGKPPPPPKEPDSKPLPQDNNRNSDPLRKLPPVKAAP